MWCGICLSMESLFKKGVFCHRLQLHLGCQSLLTADSLLLVGKSLMIGLSDCSVYLELLGASLEQLNVNGIQHILTLVLFYDATA